MRGRAYEVALVLLLLGGVAVSGCGSSRGRIHAGGGLPADCELSHGATRPGGELRIAISEPVRSGAAPFAGNDSEALLFRQLYEGLTLLGCDGAVLPALAESWSVEEESGRWRFRLRAGARFWDGSAVHAADVIAAWLWAARRARSEGLRFPDPLLDPLAERVSLVDSLTLEIAPESPCADLPRRLAAPAYAVSAGRPLLDWRIGTGPFRPRALHLPAGADVLCTPNLKHPGPPVSASLRFESDGGGDYDRLANGADAFLLRDPGALRYYERREELRIIPLAWDRLYLLSLAPGASTHPAWLESLTRDLSSGDLLQGQARGPGGDDTRRFLPFPLRVDEPEVGRRLEAIYYRKGDPVARDLALRIAALQPGAAALGGPGDWGVGCRALDPDDLSDKLDAILAGGESAALLQFVRLGGSSDPRLERSGLIPIAVTRPLFVILEDLGGGALDGWGGLHLRTLARLEEETP